MHRTPSPQLNTGRHPTEVGCEDPNEKVHDVETATGGVVRIRVRTVPFRAYLGGHGYTLARRYEVAVRSPLSIRMRMGEGGFVTINQAFLYDDLTVPPGPAEVVLAVAAMVEREDAARLQAKAADRGAVRPERGARPPMPDAGDAAPKRLRRVPPAPTTKESLRRLLCARCVQLERRTGEDADTTRHEAALAASADRAFGAPTSSSKGLDAAEMADAVTWVEHRLDEAGFDFEAADAEYQERQAARAALRSAA